MASLRDIRRRILSVKNTRQITSAMKLVAGAKLRRATENAQAARPYQDTLARVLGRVASSASNLDQPLLRVHDPIQTVAITVFSSDRGLCGGFNSLLLRYTERLLRQEEQAGHRVVLRTYGKKTRDYLAKRGHALTASTLDLKPAHFHEAARELAVTLRVDYEHGDIDRAMLVFNEFRSVASQRPCTRQLLPISLSAPEVSQADASDPSFDADYTFEPDAAHILDALLPIYVETAVLQALLETEAGEHAARMRSMDAATRNASDIIDALTLEYNRARQAAITKELIEIVSGAQAL
jgi:F-type H+-transporting ATPase subunit gamma